MPAPRIPIVDLPEQTSIVGTDLLVVQNGATTKKMLMSVLTGTGEVSVGPDAPTDASIELWYDTDEPSSALGSISGPTVDTGESYRLIMFSDGTCRAIPVSAEPPGAPTSLTLTIRVNSVKLSWTAGSGATSYRVYRDGVFLTSVTTTKFRDANVTAGQTYTYSVQAVSFYGLRSASTADQTAFVDPALNVTPYIDIRVWPPTSIALGNRAIVRVNAIDVDGQQLAIALGTDVGSLIATADPTVWYLDPA